MVCSYITEPGFPGSSYPAPLDESDETRNRAHCVSVGEETRYDTSYPGIFYGYPAARISGMDVTSAKTEPDHHRIIHRAAASIPPLLFERSNTMTKIQKTALTRIKEVISLSKFCPADKNESCEARQNRIERYLNTWALPLITALIEDTSAYDLRQLF